MYKFYTYHRSNYRIIITS